MNDLPQVLTTILLLNLVAALVRVMRGPTAADRLLAALLFGTAGVAVLVLLAETAAAPALVDVALVFALLAAVTGAAFAQRAWRRSAGDPDGREVEGDGHGGA